MNYKDQKTDVINCKHAPVTLIVPNGENSFFAVCYERNDLEHKTKGYALQYLFECIETILNAHSKTIYKIIYN